MLLWFWKSSLVFVNWGANELASEYTHMYAFLILKTYSCILGLRDHWTWFKIYSHILKFILMSCPNKFVDMLFQFWVHGCQLDHLEYGTLCSARSHSLRGWLQVWLQLLHAGVEVTAGRIGSTSYSAWKFLSIEYDFSFWAIWWSHLVSFILGHCCLVKDVQTLKSEYISGLECHCVPIFVTKLN